MSVDLCTVTGILYGPDGNSIANETIRFYRQGQPITPLSSGAVGSRVVSAITDGTGAVNVDLEQGATFIARLTYNARYIEQPLIVPAQASADIADLFSVNITSASASATNAAASAASAAASLLVQIKQEAGNYTLALSDQSKLIEINSASPATITIPPNSAVSFPVGAILSVASVGEGTVTVAGGAGVTLRAPFGEILPTQYAVATVYQRAPDEWVLSV